MNLEHIFESSRQSARNFLPYTTRQEVIRKVAELLKQESETILKVHQEDLSKLPIDDPRYDRLFLNEKRLEALAQDLEKVSNLSDPLNILLETYHHPNGLLLEKKTTPLGVIAMVYESRPNVTLDGFSLSFLSGNSCLLKGSREAEATNQIFVQLIHRALESFNISKDFIHLLPSNREVVNILCKAKGKIDLLIPRGGQSLINFVRENAQVPVIETGAGVVHTYFDKEGDVEIARPVIHNAKARRVSVCNALDCLIFHQDRLQDLPSLLEPLRKDSVLIYADKSSFAVLKNSGYPFLELACEEHFGTEFLSHKMAIKTVSSIEEAISHIQTYTSGHSEAVITENENARDRFFEAIDAAALFWNASTAFTDGGEFGMGAEIGISTQKLHVRGPFSHKHLVTTKWLAYGNGQIRP